MKTLHDLDLSWKKGSDAAVSMCRTWEVSRDSAHREERPRDVQRMFIDCRVSQLKFLESYTSEGHVPSSSCLTNTGIRVFRSGLTTDEEFSKCIELIRQWEASSGDNSFHRWKNSSLAVGRYGVVTLWRDSHSDRTLVVKHGTLFAQEVMISEACARVTSPFIGLCALGPIAYCTKSRSISFSSSCQKASLIGFYELVGDCSVSSPPTLKSTAGCMSRRSLMSVVAQGLYVITYLRTRIPNFRHNDITPENVLCTLPSGAFKWSMRDMMVCEEMDGRLFPHCREGVRPEVYDLPSSGFCEDDVLNFPEDTPRLVLTDFGISTCSGCPSEFEMVGSGPGIVHDVSTSIYDVNMFLLSVDRVSPESCRPVVREIRDVLLKAALPERDKTEVGMIRIPVPLQVEASKCESRLRLCILSMFRHHPAFSHLLASHP